MNGEKNAAGNGPSGTGYPHWAYGNSAIPARAGHPGVLFGLEVNPNSHSIDRMMDFQQPDTGL
jgi:hypothetical protein